jgi:putative transferase (TIGR04331 family)
LVSRILVTTSIKETWPEDGEPILFLGDWCRLFERKSEWVNLDSIVAPYHWNDRNKLREDSQLLQEVYESTLYALMIKLNEVHDVNHSLRYWRILVGPWLNYFVHILFDRWFMLQQVANTYDISRVIVLKRKPGENVPNDMFDWVNPRRANDQYTFIGDDWNESIYAQILEAMSIPIVEVGAQKKMPSPLNSSKPIQSGEKSFKKRISSLCLYILGLTSRKNEYFFITSYLDRWTEALLSLRLGQIPKFWHSIKVHSIPFESDMRCWRCFISKENMSDAPNDFIEILDTMIAKNLPRSYLEGYDTLVSLAERLPWPKKPKAIFDSCSWNSDDVFKAWAATKVEEGSPLVTGQHGGNYGMALWNCNESHQVAISDIYLSWGWDVSGQSKVKPVGNFKDFNRKIMRDPNGIALMVTTTVPRYSYHSYSLPISSCQWQSYFDDQCYFVGSLPDILRAKLLVRLNLQDFGHAQQSRWKSHFPDVALDDGDQSITLLLKKARICISTYNATSYLETMSLNLPTIIFWNPAHWELRESVEPYFMELKRVGIFHESPGLAAKHMESVWDDIDAWWLSEEVQLVRRNFCRRFSAMPKNIVANLEAIIRSTKSVARKND